MTRRKSRKIVKVAKKPKLDKEFECPFCCHPKAVEVAMDRQRMLGNLRCRTCDVIFCMQINHLDEPVDVFGAWIDRAVEANQPTGALQATVVDDDSSNVHSMPQKYEENSQHYKEEEDIVEENGLFGFSKHSLSEVDLVNDESVLSSTSRADVTSSANLIGNNSTMTTSRRRLHRVMDEDESDSDERLTEAHSEKKGTRMFLLDEQFENNNDIDVQPNKKIKATLDDNTGSFNVRPNEIADEETFLFGNDE